MKKFTILIIAFLVSFPTSYSQLCQWADMIDGNGIDYVECVTNDAAGNFYVCGSSSSGTINFNNGITLTSSGYYDGFIAKYNSDGLCQWARKIAGSSNDKAYSCNVDFEGSVIVSGEFESYTLWLDDSVSLSGYGTSDSYIAKYNNNGFCLWAERIYGPGRHRGYSITTDGAGNIYIGGEFSQSVNFNNSISLTSSGGTYTYDGFVAKYNYYGNCQWANKVYGSQSEEVNSLTLDNNGNIYAAGTFNSPTAYINENITLLNSGDLDVFIAKYDNFGGAQWFTKISSINGDKTYSIDFDGSEHLYIGGSYFGASVEFNNGISLTNSGSEDAFFAKYDLTGQCQWAEKTTGTSDELVYSVKVKDLNTIYIGGYFRNQPVTFNNGISLTNSGNHDAFLAEYNSSGECQWAEKIAGTAQEWVRSIDYSQNGIYLGGSFESTLLNFNNDISLTYSTYAYGGFIAKYSLSVQLTPPVLISPENNSTNYVFNPTMQWQPVENASSYSLQISTTNDFSSLLVDESGITETNYQVFGLTNNTNYYWRVCAVAGSQTGNWSEVWNFTIMISNVTFNINLSQGWNQISSNVIPQNPNMVDVFSEISESIVLVKNGMGQVYSPVFQINNIGDWDITQGYQLYCNSDCILEITGIQVIPDDTPIELNAGWNLIAFVHPYEVSAEIELESILPYLIIAKDNYGRFFVPEYNINTIGNMLPGQGYWVYVTQAVILTHPQLDRK